jgi:cytochrome c oxidase cbb3-type subunit 3
MIDTRVLIALLAATAIACSGPGVNSAKSAGTTIIGVHHAPPSQRYASHVDVGGAVPPADSLVNPLTGNADAVQKGEALFRSMNCIECHGGGGLGSWAPSLVDGRWAYGSADGALYQSIFYGRPRGMPAFGGMLSDTTIWQLITYIRAQPVPKEVPTVSWP